jgi:hypothetical protein
MSLPFRTRRPLPSAARGPGRPLALVLLVGALALALWGALPHGGLLPLAASAVTLEDDREDNDLGAVTCDFQLSNDLSLVQAVPILELDRRVMSAQPGFIHKHIPIGLDFATGDVFSGGRYLFDSVDDAQDYLHWLQTTPLYDGVKFFDRPYVLKPECHAWSVIGSEEFGDIDTSQVVVRTERWTTPEGNQRALLKDFWPEVRKEAKRRGLTGVWLLYNKKERLVSIVTFADRIGPDDTDDLDVESLGALAAEDSLGEPFDDAGWGKVFDRTQFVLTIWFPFKRGDTGTPSVWPNSPPFPAP